MNDSIQSALIKRLPYIPHFVDDGMNLDSVSDLMAEVRRADAVVIITNHKTYDYPAILDAASLIVDTRNALGDLGKTNPKVVRL
jgi:UDP-N-acetyl-D-glucosamine dehydrogenase